MSTFDGLVSEFPDIRIDYFRQHHDRRPPLACFLSHVHSDHLAGLESLKSPFVYCSAATKAILLRLERYPCRINFLKGILEARVQTFKAVKNILKPIPLETPTTIELEPGNEIQVTLFDANHCPGAVMFLIEGSGKAILYTGDVRSEPWFVNSIVRKPSLVHYTGFNGKILDKIYLDTSFHEDINFQTKAEGIQMLIRKIESYPPDTIFHFPAWTYGYEDVWIALSKTLRSKIHVDEYKMRVYSSLTARLASDQFPTEVHLSPEAPALTGFMCGNKRHEGCLTLDENVRIHSCEKGNYCSVVRNSRVVRIQPAVAILDDMHLTEVGVGGGGDDLNQEPELDVSGREEIAALCQLFDTQVPNNLGPDWLEERRDELWRFIDSVVSTGRRVPIELDPAAQDTPGSVDIKKALEALSRRKELGDGKKMVEKLADANGPELILFPYSRHSSYAESCHLVDSFQPRDVWPCTVHPKEWLQNGLSIDALFGPFCRGDYFAHDKKMMEIADELEKEHGQHYSQFSQANVSEVAASIGMASSPPPSSDPVQHDRPSQELPLLLRPSPELEGPDDETTSEIDEEDDWLCEPLDSSSQLGLQGTIRHTISSMDSHMRVDAYLKMRAHARGERYEPIGLLSTSDNHGSLDVELGDVGSASDPFSSCLMLVECKTTGKKVFVR